MVKRVVDESTRGCVYAIDIQNDALENTSSLLEDSLNPHISHFKYIEPVKKLLSRCLSKMGKVVPKASLLKFVCDVFGIHVTLGKVVNYITALYQEPQHMNPNKAKIDDLGAFRLVAFNLGYLLADDNKKIITKPKIPLLAWEAAKGILMLGGLISLVVYVGHPGGW
ncbi:hypothetical protein CFP56_040791 [Quercus suber]|uniref:Uncharacterized protein n=1 Tax=Quercus suber TaxID=58331 RepID=A0AAW0LLG5_QUESU